MEPGSGKRHDALCLNAEVFAMKSIKIRIVRSPEEIFLINSNHAEFIYSIRGKDSFLKRAAADFLNKKKYHERTSKKDIF